MLKRTSATQGDRLVFNVLVPGAFLSRAVAKPTDRCRVLKTLFPDRPMTYIYDGQVLDLNRTFDFYQVGNSDSIIAVPESDSVAQTGRWIQASRDSEAFDALMNSMMQLSTRRESMRLRDLAIRRKELHTRRELHSLSAVSQLPGPEQPRQTTNVTGRADRLSTDPLPECWR